MNIYADKKRENTSRAAAHNLNTKKSNSNPFFHLAYNRPEAIAQRKLQEMADNRLHARNVTQLNTTHTQKHGEVVQRLMSTGAFKSASQTGIGALLGKESRPDYIQQIDNLLRRYHMIADAKNPKAIQNTYDSRAQVLHQLQTHIFKIMHQEGYKPNSGHHSALMTLLDSVQSEQRQLSDHQLDRGLKLWVPGRDQMAQQQQTAMDTAWHSITHNQGQLTVSENAPNSLAAGRQQVKGFKRETYANMARLMATPTGRRLLMGLDAGPHKVTVEPTYADMTREEQRENIKAYGPERPGIDREQQVPGGLAPGTGSASLVRMLPSFSDTDMLDFNAGDQPILSPAYVALGHELIHALHNQRGVAWDPRTHNPANYAQGQPLAHYHNPEEQHTIAYQHPVAQGAPVPLEHITENMIRRESGLSEREGHTGAARQDITYSKIWGLLNQGKFLRPRQ